MAKISSAADSLLDKVLCASCLRLRCSPIHLALRVVGLCPGFGLTPADRSRLIAHGKLNMNGNGSGGKEDKPNGEDLLSG